ncbi:MAG TPA: dihydrofolate reductase family protein [Puia sp.]|nr:dihydrofolate reductase family protein [Puia sp.]
MRKLIVFNHVSIDGYFTGENGDFRWAHTGSDDPEYQAFVAGNASGEGELLFGRITYDLMAGYWPTPIADQQNPVVAKAMNNMQKVVFSGTMEKASWNNTRLVRTDIVSEIRKMKNEAGPGMVIMGSGNIISQLAQEQVIDEYHVIVNPIALGKGRTMFDGMDKMLSLKLICTRSFNNGKVLLHFEPGK